MGSKRDPSSFFSSGFGLIPESCCCLSSSPVDCRDGEVPRLAGTGQTFPFFWAEPFTWLSLSEHAAADRSTRRLGDEASLALPGIWGSGRPFASWFENASNWFDCCDESRGSTMTFPLSIVFPSSTREKSFGTEKVGPPKFSGPELATLDERRSMARKENGMIW